jgi:hypothetical protein
MGSIGVGLLRPDFRNASRNTYSICAFKLRNSSSDQRCIADNISSLIRRGYAFFAKIFLPQLTVNTNYQHLQQAEPLHHYIKRLISY